MLIPSLHDWPDNAAEALIVQMELRHRVRLTGVNKEIRVIAGIDCSFPDENTSRAVIVLMNAKTLLPIHHVDAYAKTVFPYIPGYLSFREIPVILKALEQLPEAPDLLMVDGAGVAHPRRLGIAAHLGVLTDLPSIGVAKSRLCGVHEMLPDIKGVSAPLQDKGERIGTVLRSKEKCLPLYISPGHLVEQDAAVRIVERCLTTYRLPEPTRIADKISKMKTGAGNTDARQTELSFG